MPHRQQIKRWRAEIKPRYIVLCGKPFYYYRDVDNYLIDLAMKGGVSRFEVIKKLVRTPRYNLDLGEWMPRCLALKDWPWSHETLYEATKLRSNLPIVRTKQVYGQTFFNKHDMDRLIEYNKTHVNDTI